MDEMVTYIALGAAAVGVLFSVLYVVLLAMGITVLKDLRDRLTGRLQ